jgi:hypothetical protein
MQATRAKLQTSEKALKQEGVGGEPKLVLLG